MQVAHREGPLQKAFFFDIINAPVIAVLDACRKKKSANTASTQTPLFIGLVAAAVGAVWYLRKRQEGESSGGRIKASRAKKGGESETRSAFKFPDVKKKAAANNLPRNKTNKKNKAKRKAEKAEKKADKYVCNDD